MKSTKKLVSTALFVAIVCVCTMVISIPTLTGGYLNAGDSAVLISAYLIGPLYGAVAAALGSALADLFLGYVVYAPATFVIKGLVVLTAFYIAKLLKKTGFVRFIIAGIAGEIVMGVGYFVYECFVIGTAGAISGIVYNIQQGVAGAVISVVLMLVLDKNSYLKKLLK